MELENGNGKKVRGGEGGKGWEGIAPCLGSRFFIEPPLVSTCEPERLYLKVKRILAVH
jgi:hypothetical protein